MSPRSGDRGREDMAPPLHDRSILHIRRMWERRLGLETGILDSSGTIFREWSGFTSVVTLRLDDALVVAGPDEALRELKALPPAELLDASSVMDALGAMSPTLFGRALLGYADASSFSPTDGTAGARGADLIDVEQALSTCGAEERDESGVLQMDTWFVVDEDDAPAAVAGVESWSDGVAHLGIVVSPAHRGKGLGLTAASAAGTTALRDHAVLQWRARGTNVASLRLGERLGFAQRGVQLTVDVNG